VEREGVSTSMPHYGIKTNSGTKAQGAILESVPELDLIHVSASTRKRTRFWRLEERESEMVQLYIAIRKSRSCLRLRRINDC
jgi:hypothetical protein